MKKLAVLLALFILSGCSPSIDRWQVLRAERFCANKEGIDSYSTFFGVAVICNSGEYLSLTSRAKP